MKLDYIGFANQAKTERPKGHGIFDPNIPS
jgi:hypothetical protein